MKGVTARQVKDLGPTLILNNTYHLSLRPGTDVLDAVQGEREGEEQRRGGEEERRGVEQEHHSIHADRTAVARCVLCIVA